MFSVLSNTNNILQIVGKVAQIETYLPGGILEVMVDRELLVMVLRFFLFWPVVYFFALFGEPIRFILTQILPRNGVIFGYKPQCKILKCLTTLGYVLVYRFCGGNILFATTFRKNE